ncbi:MAG: riboflavin synthase [Bacteroidia bacterium]|nr:riboflavin synthase [Bacteroidia bacterium]
MFSGIVEAMGKVVAISEEGTNKTFTIEHQLADELYIDQSISHNGVCLTIVSMEGKTYKVQAIDETLSRSNLSSVEIGDSINLERSMLPTTRIDGHLVQGHVDCQGEVLSIEDKDGSWIYTVGFPSKYGFYLVEKGSVCINGISLTVAGLIEDNLSVAIIPYTYQYTNFQFLKAGDKVNLEFDTIGKYIINYLQKTKS